AATKHNPRAFLVGWRRGFVPLFCFVGNDVSLQSSFERVSRQLQLNYECRVQVLDRGIGADAAGKRAFLPAATAEHENLARGRCQLPKCVGGGNRPSAPETCACCWNDGLQLTEN